MRLRALTGLEREKLEAEYAELMKKIEEYRAILADRKLLLGVIRKEILVISEKYGDERRTHIGYDEFVHFDGGFDSERKCCHYCDKYGIH